jgi:hypothetical protein
MSVVPLNGQNTSGLQDAAQGNISYTDSVSFFRNSTPGWTMVELASNSGPSLKTSEFLVYISNTSNYNLFVVFCKGIIIIIIIITCSSSEFMLVNRRA